MDDLDLGAALRSLRTARRLSLDATAIASGVPRATLSAWENGTTRPRGKALARLLNALETEPRLRARLLHAADPAFAQIVLPNGPMGAPVHPGLIVRAMRGRNGVTQADLARAVGVNQGTVARWESGESIPSGTVLHAVAHLLGASPEEAVALACAQGTSHAALPNDPETARHDFYRTLWEVPFPLREVYLLGVEAELWRRSARDAQWDPLYCRVLGERANECFVTGRLGEVEEAARRALRRANSPEARSEASTAVGVLVALARHAESPPAGLARRLEGWIERLQGGMTERLPGGSRLLSYMMWERARLLVRLDREREAMDDLERVLALHWSDYDGSSDVEMSYNATKYRVELLLETSRPERAAELFPDFEANSGSPLRLNVGIPAWHAAGTPVPQAYLDGFRAWVVGGRGDCWILRERLAKMERDQARLLGAV